MAMPDDLGTATIVWRASQALIDSPEDEDQDPDFSPLVGAKVTLIAAVNRAVYMGSPVQTIIMGTIDGETDASGTLVGPDGVTEGLKVLSTDNELINPQDFTYTVTITGAGPTITFSIAAPTDAVIDLSTVIPIKTSGGTAVTPIDNSAAIEELSEIIDDVVKNVIWSYNEVSTDDYDCYLTFAMTASIAVVDFSINYLGDSTSYLLMENVLPFVSSHQPDFSEFPIVAGRATVIINAATNEPRADLNAVVTTDSLSIEFFGPLEPGDTLYGQIIYTT